MELEHGTRARYSGGCRCDDCRAAENDYRKELRKRKTAAVGRSTLHAVPTPEAVQPVHGDVQQPVLSAPGVLSVVAETRREIDTLAGADMHPGLVATALRLASMLDNPEALSQWPSASRQLKDLLEELGKGGRKQRGKLAAVREMTGTA